jgi:hypothetical protein
VLVLAVSVAGVRVLRRRWPGGADRLLVLAAGGFLLAAAGTGPGAPVLQWLVGHVPGAGLLRDGQKFLMPYALLVALGFGLGAERLADRLTRRFEPAAGRVLLAGAVLLPVVVLPDLAAGAAGALRPVRYPGDWDAVATRVAAAPGEVLSWPFEGYQRYAWTRGTVVRDPAPRYLDAPVLMNDALRVGAVTVDGENPRAGRAAEHLAAGRPAAALGVRWVLVRRGPGAEPPATVLSGLRLAYDGPYLRLWANPGASDAAPPAGPRTAALAAHLLAAGIMIFAAVALLRARRRPWYRPPSRESSGGRPWPSWPRSSSPPPSAPSSEWSASSPPSAR